MILIAESGSTKTDWVLINHNSQLSVFHTIGFNPFFHDDKLIQLNTGLSDKTKIDTLRHEMMEASLLISGVGFSDNYEQEAIIRCMEEIFFPSWEIVYNKLIE